MKTSEKDDPQYKRLNVNLPEEKYKKLKLKALQENLSLSELINKWVNDYLDKKNA